MRTCRVVPVVVAMILLLGQALAQSDNPLTRDEVAVMKKKLTAVLGSLGQPPAGYGIDQESFNLPTEASKVGKTGLYYPVYASVTRTYGTRTSSEKANKDFQKEYEKKMLEAQAKGDYQTMSKLAQEMQQKSSQMQLQASENSKEPTDVEVRLNSNPGATIDPDGVLFEKPGVIALRVAEGGSSDKATVSVYFDPVSLKATKELSRVDLKMPDEGTKKKTAVYNITLELRGPASVVESWAKRIDTKAVLAQIGQ